MIYPIHFFFGAAIVLLALGILSVKLTFSGFFPGREPLGWGLLCISVAAFVAAVSWMSRGDIDLGTIVTLFQVVVLSLLLALQGPLVIELFTLVFLSDPGKGLKLLKVHSEAERKVIEDDLPGAITEYERIVAEDPKDFPAHYRLAELCCENNDYEKAAKAYRAIVSHGSELGASQRCTALTRLSEIYANNLGDIEKARRCIQSIIKEYPETKYAGHASARLENM